MKLELSKVRTDGGTQMRAALSQDVYFDYRDKMLAGVEFDPVDVFYDGATYWLADGFHRFYGAREAKLETINATVHQGTQRDAILFACAANATHGLRRTNADKRRAVEALLNDDEWATWSDNKIAEQAAVSDMLVRDVRKQLQDSCSSSPAARAADKPRTGKDGKQRKPPAPKEPASKGSAVREHFDAKEPKGRQPKFADSQYEAPLGQLVRYLTERFKACGGPTWRDECKEHLATFEKCLKEWRKEFPS